MSEDIESHRYIENEMKKIPEQLHDILVPNTEKGLIKYLENIISWKLKSSDRQLVFNLWKKYKDRLPLEARKWPLAYMRTQISIIRLKDKLDDYEDDGYGDSGGGLFN